MAAVAPKPTEAMTANTLFEAVESRFPSAWAEDRWYLTMIGALVGSGQAKLCGELYLHLIAKSEYQSPAQRQRLVRRMREAIIKCIILNGVPSAIEAIISIVAVEKQEDKDYSFSRKHWKRDAENEKRALDRLRFLYRDDFDKIIARCDGHRDLVMMATEISYGLFLSDSQILDVAEAEMIILPAIMCQNLPAEALWHLRGCVRAGIKPDDVELIQQCIEMVAQFANRPVDKVGRVTDIKDELYNL